MRSFISKVAHRLSKEVKPVAIYSSDLKRAAETAQTIARICNVPNVCPFYSSPLMLCVHFSWRVTYVIGNILIVHGSVACIILNGA